MNKNKVRASNHEGSYYYIEKSKIWRYRESYIDAENNSKIKEIRDKSRAKLKEKVQRWKSEMQQGVYSNDSLTVEKWAKTWLTLIEPTIRQRTLDDYTRVITKKILPKIGKKKLKLLTSIDCQKMLNDYAHEELSPTTVNDIRTRLKVMISAAYQQGLITKDIGKLTKPIKQQKKEIIALTQEQAQKILEIAKTGSYISGFEKFRSSISTTKYNIDCTYNILSIALNSGARIGEIFGLTWNNVNFSQNTIYICQSLSRTSAGLQIEDVKTNHSRRILKMPIKCMKELHKWKKEQEEYAQNLGNLYDIKQHLVFTNSFGKPINFSNFYNRYFNKIKNAADIPKEITFHSLRKTHCSLLLQAGVNVKVVANRLGHSTTAITEDIYQAILPGMQDHAIEALDNIFKK